MLTLTFYFDTLWYNLKSHHPVVMKVPLHQFLPVEVQDEGQVVVQIKLGEKKKRQLTPVAHCSFYSVWSASPTKLTSGVNSKLSDLSVKGCKKKTMVYLRCKISFKILRYNNQEASSQQLCSYTCQFPDIKDQNCCEMC